MAEQFTGGHDDSERREVSRCVDRLKKDMNGFEVLPEGMRRISESRVRKRVSHKQMTELVRNPRQRNRIPRQYGSAEEHWREEGNREANGSMRDYVGAACYHEPEYGKEKQARGCEGASDHKRQLNEVPVREECLHDSPNEERSDHHGRLEERHPVSLTLCLGQCDWNRNGRRRTIRFNVQTVDSQRRSVVTPILSRYGMKTSAIRYPRRGG